VTPGHINGGNYKWFSKIQHVCCVRQRLGAARGEPDVPADLCCPRLPS
jgi:hypothetical protein